jgi:trehalose 6-phosphate phosphatase
MTEHRSGSKRDKGQRPAAGHGTQHLFDCWVHMSERIRLAEHLALFLDFDGTLAPFRVRPEAVSMSDSTRRVLRRLVRYPQVRLFILSGRRRADVEHRVRVAGISYLGLHGCEGPTTAAPKALAPWMLRQAKRQLQHSLADLCGVWIEEKGAIFAVHCRGAAASAARRAGATVRRVMKSFEPYLRVLPGNQVWEVIPLELEGKGGTVRTLLRAMPAMTLPIYLGDDTTDESAFVALRHGITVCIGARQPTQARFLLRGPQEVRRFLQKMERKLRQDR